MAVDLSQYTLGEHNETIRIEESSEVFAATLEMAKQAKRSIDIFTQQLDRRIYDDKTLYDAVLKLATSSRHALVRILIQDSTPVAKQGNRLVELSYRISSRIQIRKPATQFQDFREELCIVDGRGLIQRRNPKRYESEVCFDAPMKSRQLLKYFDECWDQSATDPELRRLSL